MTCANKFSLVAAMLAVFAVPALGQNVLSNPGFEDPVASTGMAPFNTNWEAFSLDGDQVAGPDTANNSVSMPRNGTQSLELVFNNIANSFAGVFQDVPVVPGDMLTFSGWHKSIGDPGGIELRIEWHDANGEIARTAPPSPQPGTEYEMFSLDGTAPVGALNGRVVYNIQSFGGVVNQQVFFDDASVTVVPEPAAITLMGLAGLLLCGLRRKF